MNVMNPESVYIAARRVARRFRVENHPNPPQIDHTIPIPRENRGGVRKYDHFYPFEDMEVGDSFWVQSTSRCTGGAITRFAKKSGWKFTSRAQSRDGKSNNDVPKSRRGLRVWRVK